MIAGPDYLDMPVELLKPSLTGRGVRTGGQLVRNMPDFSVYHRYAANFPWRSHAKWIVSQMIRWNEADETTDVNDVASAAYGPELYCKAAKALGLSCPQIDEKLEGANAHAWLLDASPISIAMGPIYSWMEGYSIRRRFQPKMF